MNIPQGVYGELSKVTEELYELADALDQCNPIMAMCEVSDIYGAIQGFVWKHEILTFSQLVVPFDFINPYCEANCNYTDFGWVVKCIDLTHLLEDQKPRYTVEQVLGIIMYRIKVYAEYRGFTWANVQDMAEVTRTAFESGHRKAKQ